MGSKIEATLRRRPLSINTINHTIVAGAGDGEEGMGNGEPPAVEDDVEEPLSPTARVFHQPGFNCHIVTVLGIGKKIDYDEIKAGLEASLARHPRFSSVQVHDEGGKKKPRWVRTNVVVEDHLVVPQLDPGATGTISDQLVEDYVSSLSTTTMDISRPLWDIHILNVRTTDAEAIAIFRVHHSLGDGISLMSLLLACTRKTSDPNSLPTVPEGRRPAPGKHRTLRAVLLRAWASLVIVWCTLVDILFFVATMVFFKDTNTPLKGTKGVEFRRKRFAHRTVSLEDVKTVKNAMGCTINDVLLGVTSAGLSRYLDRSFAEGIDGRKKKKTGLPPNIRIRSTLLVNIRPTPGIHALAEMMKGESSSARWGNCLGYMVMRFPILKSVDPLDYVRRAKVIADKKKKSLEASFTNTCAFWVVKLFSAKTAADLCHRVLSHTTLSFSNVVGPVEEVGFYGHPLIYLAPSVYGHPQALTLHFQSYMNRLTMVMAVDELTIPDPHQLLDDLVESLKLIKDAASPSSKKTDGSFVDSL